MGSKLEDFLRFQFKSGDLINVTWLKNHAHMSQEEIDALEKDGVLEKIAKNPNDRLSDDKYRLI